MPIRLTGVIPEIDQFLAFDLTQHELASWHDRLNEPEHAERIERAVDQVLDQGLWMLDIMAEGITPVGTQAMGDAG